ncbi:MAG: hypothetical protein IJE07_12730 [Clostridia bacterium]|nr:hypothetical protein [Clostridia bacterium]
MYQMTHGFPRWFRLLFVAVMLALCTVLVTQIIRHQSLIADVADLQGKLDSAQKRLALQQKQLREATEELPDVLAQLETAAPAAQAAADRVTELKTQRSTLREEVAAQNALIAELEAQLAALPAPAATSQQVEAALSTLSGVCGTPQE